MMLGYVCAASGMIDLSAASDCQRILHQRILHQDLASEGLTSEDLALEG